MSKKEIGAGAFAGLIIGALLVFGFFSMGYLGSDKLNQMTNDRDSWKANYESEHELRLSAETNLSQIENTTAYSLVKVELAGNTQYVSLVEWITSSSQDTIETIEWIRNNGQQAINLINGARKTNEAVNGFKQTLGL